MRKVLLVNTNQEKNPYPVPPLGLCLVAGVLSGEYEVRIHDGAFQGASGLADTLETFRPDCVGVTIRNIDDMDILNPTRYLEPIRDSFITTIRSHSKAPLVLGGSAFSIFPEHLLGLYGADYGLIGEGELVFPELLRCLDRSGDPTGIPGVLSSGRSGFVPASGAFDLASLPFSQIDMKIDFAPYRARGSYPVQTKRGCAHRCIYCTYNCIEGTRYRLRRPADIADEIEQAAERLGGVTFEFVDSTFNDPPGHAEEICRDIARRNIGVRLRTMGINPANASTGLFGLMRAAGFAQVDCTPDTASPRMLVNLQKNFTLDQLRDAARMVREFDMPTMWFFIFGGPGETEETIAESFDFIDAHIGKKDMVHMTAGLRIYPGTGLYGRAIRDGVLGEGDPAVETRFYVSPALGKERLFELLHQAALERPNCIPVNESTPPPSMMARAVQMREELGLTEPMFRSLLRIRYSMMGREMDQIKVN